MSGLDRGNRLGLTSSHASIEACGVHAPNGLGFRV